MNIVNTGSSYFILILLGFAIVVLMGIFYWLLTQLISINSKKETPPHKTTNVQGKNYTKPVNQPTEDFNSEPGNPKNQFNDPGWIKEEYPDAVVMDAKQLVQYYKNGKRDFRNVFPNAAGPYENHLKWATLDGIDFSRAILFKAPFDNTSLIGAIFNGAYLEGASFKGAILRQADLSWADLRNSNFSGADLTGARMNYASLHGADFSNTILIGITISQEQLESVSNLEGAIMPDGTRHS